jgi:hypothetical protein
LVCTYNDSYGIKNTLSVYYTEGILCRRGAFMDREDELELYAQQGKDHLERGIDCPPSDRLNEVTFRSLVFETSIEEADEAYYKAREED